MRNLADNIPAESITSERVSPFQKIGLILLLILACASIITIPFIVFLFQNQRPSERKKKLMLILHLIAAFVIILAITYYGIHFLQIVNPEEMPGSLSFLKESMVDPKSGEPVNRPFLIEFFPNLNEIEPIHPFIMYILIFVQTIWANIEENPVSFYILLSLNLFFGIFMNRWAAIIFNHFENESTKDSNPPQTGWIKLKNAFRWKGLNTGLNSGNETLMKVKNSAKNIAFSSLLFLGATIAALLWRLPYKNEEQIMLFHIMDDLMIDLVVFGNFNNFNQAYTAYLGVYGVLLGGYFLVSQICFWFYLGRLIAYYSQFSVKKTAGKLLGRILGYIIAISWLLPSLISLFNPSIQMTHNEDILLSIGKAVEFHNYLILMYFLISTLYLMAFIGFTSITIHFLKHPKEMKLEPPPRRQPICQEECQEFPNNHINTAVFQISILGLSIINGWIWFSALSYYMVVTPWFDWGFYLFFGLITIALPVIMLFFLDSVYIRRIYLIYFLYILIFTAIELYNNLIFTLDPSFLFMTMFFGMRVGWSRFNDIWAGERNFHIVLIYAVIILSIMCMLILKRKALHIPIRSKTYALHSTWQNLCQFTKTSVKSKRHLINFGTISALILFSGLYITLEHENQLILLERPADHHMNVAFWTSGFDFSNETLALFQKYNIRLYGWFNAKSEKSFRYAAYGIPVYSHISFEGEEENWHRLDDLGKEYMDYWDAWVSDGKVHPFKGFIFDREDVFYLHEFNSTWNQKKLAHIQNFTNYVTSRGYEVILCEYLVSINDQLDGDDDFSTLYRDPFNPFLWENMSRFNWMIYRKEKAITYDEPYVYFTYQWANTIRNFMLQMGGKPLLAKSSMSLGVTSDEMYLYSKPEHFKEQWLEDVKICHACEIGEIIIFYSTPESSFHVLWGDQGVIDMMETLNSYERVEIPYKRRASVLGNLKISPNITGSVFGQFYADIWLDNYIGQIGLVWLVSILALSPFLAIKSFKYQKAKNVTIESQNESINPTENQTIPTNFIEKATRIILVLVIALIIIRLTQFFWYPEILLWNM